MTSKYRLDHPWRAVREDRDSFRRAVRTHWADINPDMNTNCTDTVRVLAASSQAGLNLSSHGTIIFMFDRCRPLVRGFPSCEQRVV